MSNEFIEEIREDVRRAELVQLWKKYGSYLIAGTIILVMGAIIGSYWNHHQHQQKINKAIAYENALTLLDEQHDGEALKVLQQIAEGSDQNYSLLALFKQVSLNQESISALNRIVENPKFDTPFRELAELFLTARLIDEGNLEASIQKLKPIADSNGPWRSMATEMIGVALMRMNNFKDAYNLFKNLVQDESASEGVRMRANACMDFMKNSAVKEPE